MRDQTNIYFLLDRSASMMSCREQTIEGFNTFLKSQKSVAGEAILRLIQFDERLINSYNLPVNEAPALNRETFNPQGSSTSLYDAIGFTIQNVGRELAALPEKERPSRVLFVILTDGQENSSREFRDPSVINEMISHQRDVYSWEFLFLGANQDAVLTGSQLGIPKQQSMTYSTSVIGTMNAFDSLSRNVIRYRSGGNLEFNEEDRSRQS